MDTIERAEVNGLAIASLVTGIFSLLFSWTIIMAVPCALLAFMFAMLSRGSKRKCGVANAGMILGFVSLGLSLILFVLLYSVLAQILYNLAFYKELFALVWNLLLFGNGGY